MTTETEVKMTPRESDWTVFCGFVDRWGGDPPQPVPLEGYVVQIIENREAIAHFVGPGAKDKADRAVHACNLHDQLVVALNGFLWLGNNLHNVNDDPARFVELYEAALVGVRDLVTKA